MDCCQDKTTTLLIGYIATNCLVFNKVFDKHSINAILAYEWNSLYPGNQGSDSG